MINGKACGGKRALWKWQQNPTDEKTTVIENGFHANQIFFFHFPPYSLFLFDFPWSNDVQSHMLYTKMHSKLDRVSKGKPI